MNCAYVCFVIYHFVFWNSGPDLRGIQRAGPRPPTDKHFILYYILANDSCLRNCDLVIMDACVRHASTRHPSFIDQFIAALDQRLQAYKLYWLVSLAALVACQHYPQKSYWQLPRHLLILDNSFVDELCQFDKFADPIQRWWPRKDQHWAIFVQTDGW